MAFEREPVETILSQVVKLAETVDRLAALKPNEKDLQQASEAMRECSSKIKQIYDSAQMEMKPASPSSNNEPQQESADACASEHPIPYARP